MDTQAQYKPGFNWGKLVAWTALILITLLDNRQNGVFRPTFAFRVGGVAAPDRPDSV